MNIMSSWRPLYRVIEQSKLWSEIRVFNGLGGFVSTRVFDTHAPQGIYCDCMQHRVLLTMVTNSCDCRIKPDMR